MPRPDVRREGAGYCSGGENQNFHSVDAFAAHHVRDAAEEQGADGRGEQGCRLNQAFFDLSHMPHRFEQSHDHADNEEVICVGEETHS